MMTTANSASALLLVSRRNFLGGGALTAFFVSQVRRLHSASPDRVIDNSGGGQLPYVSATYLHKSPAKNPRGLNVPGDSVQGRCGHTAPHLP